MATVVYGEFNEGDLRHFLDINTLAPDLPPLTDGAQLAASILALPGGAKLVAIVVPAAAGPAQPSEVPTPAPALS